MATSASRPFRRGAPGGWALLVPLALVLPWSLPDPADDHGRGAALIRADDVEDHLESLTATAMDGRDSPSAGLAAAGLYIAEAFANAGLRPAPDAREALGRVLPAPAAAEGTLGPDGPDDSAQGASGAVDEVLWHRPFLLPRPGPVYEDTFLALRADEDKPLEFIDGIDFVPVTGAEGEANGELVFVGYAISSSREKYDDLKGLELRGKVALVFSGEPRNRRRFDGPEVTPHASLWSKLRALDRKGVAGVLVVRRPGEEVDEEDVPMGFRHTWAEWAGHARDRKPESMPPTLEISPSCATALLGRDAEELAGRLDRNPRPLRLRLRGRAVDMGARTRPGDLRVDNIVGLVRGSDATLAGQALVVGAHYDHLGVGPRGRVAVGADDNGSGTSALIELAQAMARAGPRRDVYFCAFAAEEDGLLGSRAFCEDPPLSLSGIVTMINMDMIGVGDAREVVVMGLDQNPVLLRTIERARKLSKTGLRRVTPVDDRELFRRSDHHSFHRRGVPTLFLFEGYPIEENPDYHTWRDTIDKVDADKVANTARLAFNIAWILANEDDRPPPPRE